MQITNTFFLWQIPYNFFKAFVIAFLGIYTKIITPDLGLFIYIIMHYIIGKT